MTRETFNAKVATVREVLAKAIRREPEAKAALDEIFAFISESARFNQVDNEDTKFGLSVGNIKTITDEKTQKKFARCEVTWVYQTPSSWWAVTTEGWLVTKELDGKLKIKPPSVRSKYGSYHSFFQVSPDLTKHLEGLFEKAGYGNELGCGVVPEIVKKKNRMEDPREGMAREL